MAQARPAAAVDPIQQEAENIRIEMVRYIRETIAHMNRNQVPELLIDPTLFGPIPNLVKKRFLQGDQPLAVAQKVSIAVKRTGYENGYDPEITNLLAVTLATLTGVRFELFTIADVIDDDVDMVLNPQPGDELPVTAAARAVRAAQQAAARGQAQLAAGAIGTVANQANAAIVALREFPQEYHDMIDGIKDEMLGIIENTLTNLIANIRNLHMRIVLDPVIRSVQGRYINEQLIAEYLPRIITLITQILGHTFGQEGPFNLEDLRLIRILGRDETFLSQVTNQSGVLKFTVSPERAIEIRADNIEDLKKYDNNTLQGINAYAYWKLMLYAPQAAWTEVKWLKAITNRSDKTWWENPAIRFDIFINAWILDTLSRVGQLKSDQSFDEKMALWKQLSRLPAGAPNKIAISQPLLNEIGLFDAFFKIDYQSLFPQQIVPNVRLNPFQYLLDEGIRREFLTQHFMEGVMIDCAKQALCVHTREITVVKKNILRSYNGIGVGNPIVADKRVDLRGLRYFLDFVDTKILSTNLERTSAPYFDLTIVMGTFMNYVSVYAFHDGIAPGNRNAWTADRSAILSGNRRGTHYPSLLTYLNELRQRVENQEPLCETTPNVYLDIPVPEDAAPRPTAPRPIPLAPAAPLLTTLAPAASTAPAAPAAPAAPSTRPTVRFANQPDPALRAAPLKSRSPSPVITATASDPGLEQSEEEKEAPQQRSGLRPLINPAVERARQELTKAQAAELAKSRTRLSPADFQALQGVTKAAQKRYDELVQSQLAS